MNVRLSLVLILLLTATGFVTAQEKPIEIEQSGMQPPIQVGRPIPSWWDVKVRGSALVEGRFEFQLKNEGRLLATTTTEDMAITGPQQRIRVMLPPVSDRQPIEQLQLEIKFHGKRFNANLGSHIMRVALSKSRTFMVLTAASRLAPKLSVERDQIARRFAFESLAFKFDETCKTVHTPLDPADIPQEPLAYCAYEMVILFADEFRQLKKPQLEAMAMWIKAGGSLYLEPTGVLEPYHVEFLRNLTAFGPKDLVIQPDSNGRLIPGTIWNDERLLRITNGLGRIVLRVDDEPLGSLETPAWREASAFLWRLHSDQAALITQNPSTSMTDLLGNRPQTQSQFVPANSGQPAGRLSLKLLTSTAELLDCLMPEGVRMVPLWVLGTILFLFVIWIGPVDYIGLGKLKARKFTWLTFPLATFLVTGLTVWITNRYMSSSETRRGLILQDVGDDGAVVRTSRFELLFIASSRPITTEIRKGVFTVLGTAQSLNQDVYSQQMYQYQQRRPYGGMADTGVDRPPPRSTGRIPTEFSVTQDMAKWTPQLNRLFWIPGPSPETPADWMSFVEGIDIKEMLRSHVIDAELQSRVKKQLGPKSLIACIGSEGQWAINPDVSWWSRQGPQATSSPYDTYGAGMGDLYQLNIPAEIQGQPELFRWLYQHSVAVPYGLFSLTSQIGPTGGADLNDLPILDGSDSNQKLLIVVVPRGDDYVVYRKLLRVVN